MVSDCPNLNHAGVALRLSIGEVFVRSAHTNRDVHTRIQIGVVGNLVVHRTIIETMISGPVKFFL